MNFASTVEIQTSKNEAGYTIDEFFEDLSAGVIGAIKGIAEPLLIVVDFGQMGAAIFENTVSPGSNYDVQFLSALNKRIVANPDQSLRACIVFAFAMPTFGAIVLADNIATVFERNMSPNEARRFLVQGAVGLVASAGIGMGISKMTGNGWTGRGNVSAKDSVLVNELVNQRIADLNTNPKGPGRNATYAIGRSIIRKTTVRQSIPKTRPLQDIHAEPQVLTDLPSWGGKTVIVDQVPCPNCWVELGGVPRPSQAGLLKSDVTGSLRVLTIRNANKPGTSPRSASLDAARGLEGKGPKVPLVLNLEIQVFFAPPIVPEANRIPE
jgi:hypothetical protein